MESRKLEAVPQDFLLGFKFCVSTSRCLFAERLVHKVKKKERRKQKEEEKKRMQISRLLSSSYKFIWREGFSLHRNAMFHKCSSEDTASCLNYPDLTLSFLTSFFFLLLFFSFVSFFPSPSIVCYLIESFIRDLPLQCCSAVSSVSFIIFFVDHCCFPMISISLLVKKLKF